MMIIPRGLLEDTTLIIKLKVQDHMDDNAWHNLGWMQTATGSASFELARWCKDREEDMIVRQRQHYFDMASWIIDRSIDWLIDCLVGWLID